MQASSSKIEAQKRSVSARARLTERLSCFEFLDLLQLLGRFFRCHGSSPGFRIALMGDRPGNWCVKSRLVGLRDKSGWRAHEALGYGIGTGPLGEDGLSGAFSGRTGFISFRLSLFPLLAAFLTLFVMSDPP